MGRKIDTEIPDGTLRLKRYEPVPLVLREYVGEKTPATPSEWFSAMFPAQAEQYGAPILESETVDGDGFVKVEPVSMNEDFFAAILGGRKDLGHKTVYFEPERQWYFSIPRLDLYCLTSDEKLSILLSQLLVRCAESIPSSGNLYPLFVTFREPDTLKQIVRRARSILAADETFFSVDSQHKREIGPEVHSRITKTFLREAVVKQPGELLPLMDCYSAFKQYCQLKGFTPVDRRVFKQIIIEAIREEFDLGLRKDLLDKDQRYLCGWKGLRALELNTGVRNN